MRMFGMAAAVIVAAGLALGGTTLASGDNGNGALETFKVYAPTANDRIAFIPVVKDTFSLGDRTVFSDDVFTSKGGDRLGIDGGVCTVVRIADAAKASGELLCNVTFSLPGGQISTQELHTLTNGELTGTQPGAITGGTGRYRGAKGEVSVEFLSTTEAFVTFTFSS